MMKMKQKKLFSCSTIPISFLLFQSFIWFSTSRTTTVCPRGRKDETGDGESGDGNGGPGAGYRRGNPPESPDEFINCVVLIMPEGCISRCC